MTMTSIRLKAYLLVLASGGMRATEALAIRESDVDWSGINFGDPAYKLKAAGVHVRKEFGYGNSICCTTMNKITLSSLAIFPTIFTIV